MFEEIKDELTIDLNHEIYKNTKTIINATSKYEFINDRLICVCNTTINDKIEIVHYCYNPFLKYDNLHMDNNIFNNENAFSNDYVKGIIYGEQIITNADINKITLICLTKLIDPSVSFLLTYLSISHFNPHRKVLLDMLKNKYTEWISTTDKIGRIKSLLFSYMKSSIENMLDYTIFNFLEVFHYHCNNVPYNGEKIIFIRGIYSICKPFVSFDDTTQKKYYVSNEDIKSIIDLTYGCNHSQLYIFSECRNYVYDSDEIRNIELVTRNNKMKEFKILKIDPIQKITDDTNCLFHTIRLMIETVKHKIEFSDNDIKKLNNIILFRTKNKTKLINKMNYWIKNNIVGLCSEI